MCSTQYSLPFFMWIVTRKGGDTEMAEIVSVVEYNKKAREEYRKAVDEWRAHGDVFTPIPFLPKYLFIDDGIELKDGYVVTDKHNAHYVKTYEQAVGYAKKVDMQPSSH